MLPDTVDGYLERAELAIRCDPTLRQLTTISAPGGFGKTTLLAEACRRVRNRRGVVAWLTIDEEDDATALATYLPFAFSEAGLDTLDSRVTSQDFEHGDYRINLLMHTIEVRGFPCVLALDDVDRLRNPESLAIVNRLIHRGPSNLHIALTFREIPSLLDIASPLLDGRGMTTSVEDLRFDKPEIARFFDTKLSRRELSELNERSKGWPIALCIHRNVREQATSTSLVQDIASNWIEARLWRGLTREEQDFVLDMGLFERIDTSLVDEVLRVGSVRRIRSIPTLSGLLQSVGGTTDAMYLHPLIRQYCADKRLRETPERYRLIHRAIADALARRGQVVQAMWHAAEASDHERVGEILEQAGASRYWLRQGMPRLLAANEMLTSEILARFPRLGLLRCMALIMAGELGQARAIYDDLDARTNNFSRNREGGDDLEIQIDDLIYRYLLAVCGCQPITSPEMVALVPKIRDLAEDSSIEPFEPAVASYVMGEIEAARANFDLALEWTTRARAELVRRSRYITMFADFQLAGIAMVQGRVVDAVQALTRGQRAAKNDFLEDPGPSVIAGVLSAELNLERNRTGSLSRRSHKMPTLLAESGASLDVYAAATEVAVELAQREGGPSAALDALEEPISFARQTERATLSRCLLGFRVSLLVAAGRTQDANALWTQAGLPSEAGQLVDLDRQTWREMEAIAVAGLRLLSEQSLFAEARELVHALVSACTERGLKRTLMRARVLAMVLEHRAGDPAAAGRHLIEYLELFADTDYPRSLLQEREIGLAVLNGLDRSEVDKRLHNLAASLIGMLENAPGERTVTTAPILTAREHDILQRLERWRDKEIGAALDLSDDGVRYHVKKIFQKLGVRSRFEATHRARSLGILPASGDEAS